MSKISLLAIVVVFTNCLTTWADGPTSVNELIRDLRSPNVERRIKAADQLAKLGPEAEPAVLALISAVGDLNEEVQNKSVAALGRIGRAAKDAVPALANLLKDDDAAKFPAAIDALGSIGPDSMQAKNDLIGFMLGEDARLSVLSCRALLRILPELDEERPQIVPILIHALSAAEPATRETAIETLGSAGTSAVPHLIKIVEKSKEDPERAARAATALGMMGGAAESAVPALTGALDSEKTSIQAAFALSAIGRAASPAVPKLAKLLGSRNSTLRFAVVRALGEIGPDAVAGVGELGAALSDAEEEVRREAAQSLGKIGPEARQAIPALIAALSDQSTDVKWQAVWALSRMGEKAVGPLTALLDDESLQDAAVVALGDIGAASKPAVPQMVKLLIQPDLSVETQIDIILAFSRIGPAAAEAAPILGQIVGDKENDIRAYAVWALAQIRFTAATNQLFREMSQNPNHDSDLSIVLPLAVLTLNPQNDLLFEAALNNTIKLLSNDSSVVRRLAATTLAHVGPRCAGSIPLLVETASDADPQVRTASLSALAAMGADAEEAIPAIIKGLADPDFTVRYAATHAAGRLGALAKEALPVLAVNVRNQDPLLKFFSAWALVRIDSKQANLSQICTEPLRWGLKSNDNRIRNEAAQGLGLLGTGAASAVPDLEAISKDDDDAVQKSASEALQRIHRPKGSSRGLFDRMKGNSAGGAK